MATRASFGGHPIHPMLIPFPLALWVFSLIADLIYLWQGNPVWRDSVAFYTLAGGIIGAILAAVPGIIDYFSIRDRKISKLAAWHARLNVLALLIFSASFYLRTTSGSEFVGSSLTIPVTLSVIGVILIAISGWIGGEMVYVHGVGVQSQGGTKGENPPIVHSLGRNLIGSRTAQMRFRIRIAFHSIQSFFGERSSIDTKHAPSARSS